MAIDTDSSWFPLFEFHEWSYQSFLLAQEPAIPSTGNTITAKTWAKGSLGLGQAVRSGEGYTLGGTLSFGPGVELEVSAKGVLGNGSAPGTFEGTGTGMHDRTKGAIYQLVGWIFADEPIADGAAQVLSVRGSVRAVRGPDAKPESELGGMPLGTVGSFEILRTA
jgi:hypothetical protein